MAQHPYPFPFSLVTFCGADPCGRLYKAGAGQGGTNSHLSSRRSPSCSVGNAHAIALPLGLGPDAGLRKACPTNMTDTTATTIGLHVYLTQGT